MLLFSKMCFIDHFRRSITSLAAQEDVCYTLKTHLKLNSASMNRINRLKIDIDIGKIPENYTIQNCTLLQNRNISLENIEYIGKCLVIKPSVLRSRIDILKELGVKSIGLDHICRFPTLMRKTLINFKKIHNIPMEENIMKTVFSNIGISYDHLAPIKEEVHNIKTGCYYKLCVFIYKTSYLNLQSETYDIEKRLRYYSLTEISKLVKLLKKECDFDEEILQKCPQLLHLEVCKVEEFLAEFKSIEIDGRKITDVLKSHPRILFYSIARIKELFHIQQTLDIPASGIRSCPNVLGMDIQRFLQRYSNIGSSTDLGIWVQHPRVISMICRYKSVERRKEHLISSNSMNNVTIHTYLSQKKHFSRFLAGDSNRIASKKYLKYILAKELGEANISLVHYVVKHPYWKYIPLLHMENMLQYLKKHFSVEDICANIHIILYPQSKIVEVLNSGEEEYVSNTGHQFTPKQHLALCLYKLEKKHHFTGDAVWQSVDPDLSDLSCNILEDAKEDTSNNNVEHVNIRDNECINIKEVAWLEYFLRC